MKSKVIIAVILVPILLAGACKPAPEATPDAASTPSIPGTGSEATPSMSETQLAMTPSAGTQVSAGTPVIAAPSEIVIDPETKLMVNTDEAIPFLTDERGRSLYVYLNDIQNSSHSACLDDCAVEWPPLTVRGKPAADAGIDASLLWTVKRDDGTLQATYNGWPLYYYGMDTIPGSTFGQSYNGVWFLISPAGEPIQR